MTRRGRHAREGAVRRVGAWPSAGRRSRQRFRPPPSGSGKAWEGRERSGTVERTRRALLLLAESCEPPSQSTRIHSDRSCAESAARCHVRCVVWIAKTCLPVRLALAGSGCTITLESGVAVSVPSPPISETSASADPSAFAESGFWHRGGWVRVRVRVRYRGGLSESAFWHR